MPRIFQKLLQLVRDYKLECFVGLSSLFGSLWILSNYSMNVPHVEVYGIFAPCTYRLKGGWNLNGLLESINFCFEAQTSRPRFLSWLMWPINTHFRTWIFQYIPLHPSLSLNWALSYLFIPYFLFKFLKNMTHDFRLSFVSTLLILFTQGFLSCQVMYFHAGKPMAMLGVIVGLYLLSQIQPNERGEYLIKPRESRKIFLTLCLFLFWDEMFYGLFLVAPLFFPFLRKRANLMQVFEICGGLFSVFFITVSWLVPMLTRNYAMGGVFNFWNYAFTNNPGLLVFEGSKIFNDLYSLLAGHLDPLISAQAHFNWHPQIFSATICILALAVFTLPFLLKRPGRKIFGQSLLGIFVFYGLVHFILTRREGGLFYGAFYWGSTLSLMFVIAYAFFWNCFKIKHRDTLIAVTWVFCAMAGYRHTASAVKGHMIAMGQNSWATYEVPTSNIESELSLQKVQKIWSIQDLNQVREELKNYPPSSYWLYFESYIRIHGRADWPNRFH